MLGALRFEDGAADVRIAVRRLRQRPGFAVAITVVAIRIGATTAVFSAIDATTASPIAVPTWRRCQASKSRSGCSVLPKSVNPWILADVAEMRIYSATSARIQQVASISSTPSIRNVSASESSPPPSSKYLVWRVSSAARSKMLKASLVPRGSALLSDALWSRRYGPQ